MADQFSNNAASTLASSITNSATSLTVASGHGALFPAPGAGFWATLEEGTTREIVRVTARSTDTFTVTRGQQGTSGTAFNAGAKVELRLTQTSVDAYETHIAATAPHSGHLVTADRFAPPSPFRSATPYYGLPGVSFTGAYGSATIPANWDQYCYFDVRAPITITSLNVAVAVAQASATIRCGIASCDGAAQPVARIVQSASIDASTTGLKSETISQALSVGRYLTMLSTNNASVQMRFIRGGPSWTRLGGDGASQFRVSRTHAAFPDPPTAWNDHPGDGNGGMIHMVFMTW